MGRETRRPSAVGLRDSDVRDSKVRDSAGRDQGHAARTPLPPLAVIKVGGSVLRGVDAYRDVASFVAARRADRPADRLVVVVSAEHGATDRLLALACSIVPEPDPAALDLLWSTGELKSVALLVLSLRSIGIRAASANVHQTGLLQVEGRGDTGSTRLRPLRLRALAARSDVVVAPGFLARGDADGIVSLGRGGSDLTAVLLAIGLGARTCELVKDVPGYFSRDPNRDADARHIPEITFSRAVEMADEGCDLVQREALLAARAHDLRVIVRALHDGRMSAIVPAADGFARAELG